MSARDPLWIRAARLAGHVRLKAARTRGQLADGSARLRFALRNRLLGNRPVTLRIENVSFQMLPMGDTVVGAWAGDQSLHRELRLLFRLLVPGQRFLDVGASAGLFAAAAGRKLGPDSVWAIEPSQNSCPLLRQNLRLNGLPEDHAMAVSIGAQGDELTLDAVIASLGIHHLDVVRINAGGAELSVFEGSHHLLSDPSAPLLMWRNPPGVARQFGCHPVETIWLLQEYGYQCFAPQGQNGASSFVCPDSRYAGIVIAARPSHAAFPQLEAGFR